METAITVLKANKKKTWAESRLMIYILKSITYESKVIEKSRSRNCSNAHVLAHISRCFDDKKNLELRVGLVKKRPNKHALRV